MKEKDGIFRCSKLRCNRDLGIIKEEGQMLLVGTLEFWNTTNAICAFCGARLVWKPYELPDEAEPAWIGLNGERSRL